MRAGAVPGTASGIGFVVPQPAVSKRLRPRRRTARLSQHGTFDRKGSRRCKCFLLSTVLDDRQIGGATDVEVGNNIPYPDQAPALPLALVLPEVSRRPYGFRHDAV